MSPSLKRSLRRVLTAYNVLFAPVASLVAIVSGAWWWAFPIILIGHTVWMTSTLWPQCNWFGEVWTQQVHAGRAAPNSLWLTIDDGPHPEDTPVLLDILERHGAQATFFFIGRNVAKYPDLVREVVRRGHTVGNHTMNHDQYWFWAYGPRGAQREVADCQAALTEAGVEARYFRAPAGLKSPFLQSAVERAGLPLVCWSARGLDGISTDRARIMARLKESARPGGIVLVHEGRADENGDRLAPDVLAALLEWLDETGIRCVLPDPAV